MSKIHSRIYVNGRRQENSPNAQPTQYLSTIPYTHIQMLYHAPQIVLKTAQKSMVYHALECLDTALLTVAPASVDASELP